MSNRDIIVVGGSAGAVAPLKDILGRFPVDLPAAIFIVLHIPARGIGILSTVVASAGKLPVRQAEDGMTVERGHVYIAGPDNHMLVRGNRIILGRGPRENMVRPAIDPLFRSAAIAYGPRVIGVVLSGLLSDGAAGLNAIKRCGGFALVQDPGDAFADEMPRRALEATEVDLCVSSARMGDVLFDLTREVAGTALPIPPELQLEVNIAAGERIGTDVLGQFADPAALTCPACGGVLSKMRIGNPLRFRCQVGHAYTADALATEQESKVDEAMRVALRIIEERAELVHRMAEEGRQSGRRAVSEMYDARAQEYRAHAEIIRQAVLKSFLPKYLKDESPTNVSENTAEEEAHEREVLRRSDEDIMAGEIRLDKQERRLASLDHDGHDTTQARELVHVLRKTLDEWHRHRVLIEKRIDYLAQRKEREQRPEKRE